jgi:hypothetical protein
MKNDKYLKSRGGWSRMLDIRCEHCDTRVCLYQKDGPGILKRMYLDRMNININDDNLVCSKCERVLGTKIIWHKENRPAYRLFVGAVTKKIVRSKENQAISGDNYAI